MSVEGFVLTGGSSTRMGTDKALLNAGGITLVERVAGRVARVAARVRLVGAASRYGHLPYACLDDERYAGCGPLSGIEAALRHAQTDWSLIVACDMPDLDPEWLLKLVTAAGSGADAVAGCSPSGQLEPLAAVYHRRLLAGVQESLAQGRFAVHKLLEQKQVIRIPGAAGNINTKEAWLRWSLSPDAL